jgi:hypothetical protein
MTDADVPTPTGDLLEDSWTLVALLRKAGWVPTELIEWIAREEINRVVWR